MSRITPLFIGICLSVLISHSLISEYKFIGQFPIKNCDYVLPKGYALEKNFEGKYRIRLPKSIINTYINKYNIGIYDLSSCVSEDATIWADSCVAKNFAKQYYEVQLKHNSFKEIR